MSVNKKYLFLLVIPLIVLVIPAIQVQVVNPNLPAITIQIHEINTTVPECIQDIDYIQSVLLEGNYYRLDLESSCIHESRLSCDNGIALFEVHFEVPKIQVGTCSDDTHYVLDFGNQEIVTVKCWTFDCLYFDNLTVLLKLA